MLHDLSLATAAQSRRPRVHFILNSKGGVGKSFIGTIIVQREQARGRPIRCFDGDATTATLSSFPALGAIRLPMMLEGSIIDGRRLDDFVEPAMTDVDVFEFWIVAFDDISHRGFGRLRHRPKADELP
jgi:hypothetical protein